MNVFAAFSVASGFLARARSALISYLNITNFDRIIRFSFLCVIACLFYFIFIFLASHELALPLLLSTQTINNSAASGTGAAAAQIERDGKEKNHFVAGADEFSPFPFSESTKHEYKRKRKHKQISETDALVTSPDAKNLLIFIRFLIALFRSRE